MTSSEIWSMLRRGGLTVRAPDREAVGGQGEPVLVGRYHGMRDPAAADELGVALAQMAKTVRPNVIVVGEGANDLILGFVVARELHLSLVRVLNLEGLVGASGTLPHKPRAAFVADRVHKPEFASAVQNLLEREGGELLAVVSLVASTVPSPSVQRIGLVTAAEGLADAP